jgi:hypothetical protein
MWAQLTTEGEAVIAGAADGDGVTAVVPFIGATIVVPFDGVAVEVSL